MPGAMFLTAYIRHIPLLGVPACGLHHKITILDLVLPRVLAGERIGKKELAFIGHGGLCKECKQCSSIPAARLERASERPGILTKQWVRDPSVNINRTAGRL